jgi:hypothetical protein
METETTRSRTLREIELEVEAEGREWTRQRLHQRLQAEAGQHGEVSPLSGQRLVHRRTQPMQLHTSVGVIKLQVLHGQDPADKHWGWPIGSGTVESACRQRQCRFKRPGQFWTPKGMRHLSALTEARHNHHWDELWLSC